MFWTVLSPGICLRMSDRSMNPYWFSFRKRKMKIISPMIYYFKLYNVKTIGTGLKVVHIVEGEWFYEILLKDQYDLAGEFLFKGLLQKKNTIKDRLRESKTISESFLHFCREKLFHFSKADNQQLILFLEQFNDYYQKYSVVNIPPWLFLGDKLSNYLKGRLQQFVKEDINNIFITLSSPNTLTYTAEAELAALRLAIKIKEGRITDFHKLNEFKMLVDDYFWVPFDYLGPDVWDAKYQTRKINELLLFDLGVLQRQVNDILEHQQSLKEKQESFIKKLKLSSELCHLFEALKDIALLQDRKKAVTTEAHYYLQNLYKELAQRTNMNYFDFYFLLESEVKDVLLDSVDVKEIVKQRKKWSITILEGGKEKILVGTEAKQYAKDQGFLLPSQEINSEINTLQGKIGSPGHIIGEVMIIDSAKMMAEFKEGKVLVTTMTTPDYVPIMKKAKAIITNEGGVTCHAAIVSRELGIPCIIGTEIATKVLKDGDIVEVDAKEGVVRVIKRKNKN